MNKTAILIVCFALAACGGSPGPMPGKSLTSQLESITDECLEGNYTINNSLDVDSLAP